LFTHILLINRLCQCAFAILQFQNFLFNCAFGNQFIYKYRFILTNAMGAIGGLCFRRRIPPWIIVDDCICSSQIQADTTGFEADQK